MAHLIIRDLTKVDAVCSVIFPELEGSQYRRNSSRTENGYPDLENHQAGRGPSIPEMDAFGKKISPEMERIQYRQTSVQN
ncbi:hypothetical protein ACFPTY_06660 [Halomonas beimenensis]|uniref:hypothetical protein n=1 Tax=Halomonas beimenensis TaxID=475662 RepID=UPI0012901D68|nr:hypothetical protein [Halomonas beimenensis]